MLTTLVAWSLVITFLMLQRVMRRGAEARSLRPSAADRGSTRLVGAAFGLGLLALAAAPALNAYGVADMGLGPVIGWVGVAVMVVGLAVRVWSQAVLGLYYTSTLRHAADQTVVASGPYRLLRHPGYAGMLVAWLGAGMTTTNWAVALALCLLMVVAYGYRVAAEEATLLGAFGDWYKEYMARTWRLVPYVY
jgi:protein-S-isoprenylcysteine O-methyltransferase